MRNYGKCQCAGCNNLGTVKVELARRGNRNAYMCEYHARREESYSTENNNRKGTVKKNGFTFSQELETSRSTEKARVELLASGYLPTSDCTVDVEYKSSITHGLNSLSKHCVTIEKLMQAGELEIDSTCGTHLHVGHSEYINSVTMDYVRRFYHSLFIPLCEAMQAEPEKTETLFGRGLTGWAQPINEYTPAQEHKNFINTQHTYTLEFRACKFKNANQYMHVTMFCKDITATVINNFIKHFNDTDIDSTRYANMRQYRKHKADVTAKKLVKLFEKYTAC